MKQVLRTNCLDGKQKFKWEESQRCFESDNIAYCRTLSVNWFVDSRRSLLKNSVKPKSYSLMSCHEKNAPTDKVNCNVSVLYIRAHSLALFYTRYGSINGTYIYLWFQLKWRPIGYRPCPISQSLQPLYMLVAISERAQNAIQSPCWRVGCWLLGFPYGFCQQSQEMQH